MCFNSINVPKDFDLLLIDICIHSQEESSIATVPTAVRVALRILEKFSARLLEDLLADEDRSVSIVQSESIVIVNQVVYLNATDPENEIIELPLKTGLKYSVSLSLPLDVAKDLSMNDRFAVSNEYICLWFCFDQMILFTY